MTTEQLNKRADDIRLLVDLLASIITWCKSDLNDPRKVKVYAEIMNYWSVLLVSVVELYEDEFNHIKRKMEIENDDC